MFVTQNLAMKTQCVWAIASNTTSTSQGEALTHSAPQLLTPISTSDIQNLPKGRQQVHSGPLKPTSGLLDSHV